MCLVSAIADYGQKIYNDGPINSYWYTYKNNLNDLTDLTNKWDGFKEYLELIRKAAEFDKLTNQPHCESPEKLKWMKDVLNKLDSLGEQFVSLKKEVEDFLNDQKN